MLTEDETQKIQLGKKCAHGRKDYLKQKQTKLVEECLLWHCSTLEDFDAASMNLAWLKFLNIEIFKREIESGRSLGIKDFYDIIKEFFL